MRIDHGKTAVVVAAALLLAACSKDAATPASSAKVDAAPVAIAGLSVTALATGLLHPRTVYPLPNGDILIVESTGPATPVLRPADLFTEQPRAEGGKVGRITLVRPNMDGGAALQTILLDGLASPSGVALVGTDLYVTTPDALVRYPYNTGDTRITAPGKKIIGLPGGPINRHWTRSLLASDNGARLYVGVGSASNRAENGMAMEQGRAAILEVDRATGTVRSFASGLRNPDAMQWEPHSQAMWVVVNERAGSNPLPDYLAAVKEGGFYGWPYNDDGVRLDRQSQRPARTIVPDVTLGARAAGLAFNNPASTMPFKLRDGAFIGQSGSGASGGKVVFLPFADGKPAGPPIDVVTGFSQGRPVGMVMDHRGALLVADDAGNTVWRISGPPLK